MMLREVLLLLLISLIDFSHRVQCNQVDIGAVHSCVPVNTTACSISYTVPEAIAALSSIKDAFIEETLTSKTQIEDASCISGIRELLCREEYPHCNEIEHSVTIHTPNCTQLLSTCTRDLTSQFCPLSLTNATLGECRQVSSYATTSGYTFKQCHRLQSDWSTTTYVTEWTFPYLMKRDQQVNEEINSIGELNEECFNRYRTFRCGGIGICHGNRVNLQTSRDDCNYLINNW